MFLFNPIEDVGEGWWAKRPPPNQISSLTSTNVGISPQNSLTYNFNSFATLV